ncbi:hypothetical protein KAU11_10620 [Candidatus Babeliales bacterium]|nr:hypothetical protein [Candidatus Babeliales bacterium]
MGTNQETEESKVRFHVKDGMAQGLLKYSPWIPGDVVIVTDILVQTLVDLPNGIYKVINGKPEIAGTFLER